MGARGPLPKPHLLKTSGHPKRRRTLAEIDQERLGVARMPSWLSDDAKSFWRLYGPRLKELGRLTKLDEAGFAMICEGFANLKQMDEQIAKDGLVVIGSRGAKVPHPLIRTRNAIFRTWTDGLRQFGMMPQARHRLPAPPEQVEEDGMERLLRGQKPVFIETDVDPRAFLGGGN